ncbi:hypothetical protein BK120_22965 [Paenibacillus sp. FSL A5-0031]|uniref:hypothetical protein n=1 Tax=Paenibacillus sp. FSL A5-0031 TaxID=1920420 RepID=UPI00096C58F2|nr:hypothetical protein [Paenibacillus sp. FSL A5-0031]OME78603.1 hypothetical protein BK120_22965 [Paenibacillus sp. FSL A5-0031]
MGRDQRSGYGCGMDESTARMQFENSLNRTYGYDTYDGGGNSITEWNKSVCAEKPVPATAAPKSKKVKIMPMAPGKLISGFRITNETPELIRHKLLAIAGYHRGVDIPDVVEEFALTTGEASKKAEELAKRLNSSVHVFPSRLWQDELTKRLSVPSCILEVSPVGGKEAKLGKWHFEVEVRV